ncbi:g8856 [Coccomyxa elongata]
MDGSGAKDNPALVEANRAARAAAVARLPVAIKKQAAVQDAVQAPQDWECTKCQNINFSTRPKCNKCGQPGPKSRQMLPSGQMSDVLKCSDAEIRDSAYEKMHPNFQQAFDEAGVPHVAGLPPGTVGGNADTVIAAMAKRGQERLNHIIRVLSEHGHLKELTTAFFGNYTLQDLLDATHKLRQAAAKLRARNIASSSDIEHMLGFSDGQDSLMLLARGVVTAMPEGATHKQGFYVVAKLLEVGEPADLLPLAAKIFPGGPQLTADLHSSEAWRSIKVMVSLVEAMSDLALQKGHMSAAAMGLLESLCGLYLKDEQQILKMATHRNCGPMLVDAAFASLPRPKSKQMLTLLAKIAGQLVEQRWGFNVLTTLLSLSAANDECKEIIVTDICVAAQALEGSFARVAAKLWSQPAPGAGTDLVWRMLQRLDEENEHGWVKSIVAELFSGILTFQRQPRVMEVLVDALCLQGLPDHAVMCHIMTIRNVMGDAKADDILQTVSARRGTSLSSQSSSAAPAGHEQAAAGTIQFGSMGANGDDQYSSAFASPPRNAAASTAPTPAGPSMLRPPPPPPPPPPSQQPVGPFQQPAAPLQQQPLPPRPPPPPAHINNGVRLPPPLLPIPPRPSQVANGVRPPLVPKRMVVPPRPKPPQPAPGARPPGGSAGVPSMLADLLPHLMVGTPTSNTPPTAQPPGQPSGPPTSALQSSQPIVQQAVNGHHMVPQNGRVLAPHASSAPSAAHPPHPKQQAVRPAQNSIAPSVAERQTVQAPAARGAVRRPGTSSTSIVQSENNAHMNGQSTNAQPAWTGAKCWSCQVCTYVHEGSEAGFLACAICGTPMPVE